MRMATKTFLATLLSLVANLLVSAALVAPYQAVYVGTL